MVDSGQRTADTDQYQTADATCKAIWAQTCPGWRLKNMGTPNGRLGSTRNSYVLRLISPAKEIRLKTRLAPKQHNGRPSSGRPAAQGGAKIKTKKKHQLTSLLPRTMCSAACPCSAERRRDGPGLKNSSSWRRRLWIRHSGQRTGKPAGGLGV